MYITKPFLVLSMVASAGFLTGSVEAESCVERSGSPTLLFQNGSEVVPIVPAFEDYSYMLFDACDAWDLTVEGGGCAIYPMMGDINWNAVAAICDGSKVIVYDRRLSGRVGYSGAQAIIAHELGHLVCGHLDENDASIERNHAIELEADAFAAATLRRLGFSLEDIFSYEPLLSESPSISHPTKSARLAALAAGWNDPTAVMNCIGP